LADQDCIGHNLCGLELKSDWKISQSDYLRSTVSWRGGDVASSGVASLQIWGSTFFLLG